MIIENKTRYNTDDLESIVLAGLDVFYRVGWLDNIKFEVTHASTGTVVPEGCFVKFNRNGDENNTRKALCLVRPNNIRGLHPLKQIEMMTSMQIPSEILIELLIRLQVIREYDSSAYGSASTKCTDHNRKTPVFRERAQRLLEARDDLKLRFSERDLTRDEQDLTTRLADASENERRALNIMKNALATVKANEGRMVSLREEINRHEAALPGLKNAHSNAIRIHALALSSKQAIKEELDTLLSRRTT